MSVLFAEDLQSRDLISVTVARETTGRRARALLEVLARDQRRGRRRPLRLQRRNHELVVPVGAEAIVEVNRATRGKLRRVWPSLSVSRTQRYAVILPDRPSRGVAGAALAPVQNRSALLQARFDYLADPVLSAMERLDPGLDVRDDNARTPFVAGSGSALPDPDRMTVNPVKAVNAMFVEVPLLEGRNFEEKMLSAGARCHRLSPLPMDLNRPHLPRDYRSHGLSDNSADSSTSASSAAAAAAAPTTVRMGAVDTGLSLNGTEFAGREGSILFAEFDRDGVYSITTPADRHGHGTCVLTRAAGAITGIVPNASLVVAGALDENIRGDIQQITNAISWVIEQDDVNVVNLSLVSTNGRGSAAYNDIFREVIQTANDLGIYLVAATGNSGRSQIGAPGAYGNVHGVGATDRRNEFWRHSSHGFVAQEANIYKPNWIAHGVALQPVLKVSIGHTGTSYACPIVSGIILRALVRELDPLEELERCSEPCQVGTGVHRGTCRRIRWPVPE